MRASIRFIVPTLVLSLMGGLPVRAAPAREALSRDALRGIHVAAGKLSERAPPCVAVEAGAQVPPENLRAEVIHEQVGAMRGMVLLQYPRDPATDSPTGRADYVEQLEDQLMTAIEAYRQAYTCHPGESGARHLTAGLDLIGAFEQHLRSSGLLEAGSATQKTLQRWEQELRAALPQPLQCAPQTPCAKPVVNVTPPAPDDRWRWMDRIFLRPELGLGGGAIQYQEFIPTPEDQTVFEKQKIAARVLGPAFRLSAGARLPVGTRRRHVLLIGGFYTFQHFTRLGHEEGDLSLASGRSEYRMMHAGGLSVEWGMRLGDSPVSLHTGGEFGVQAFHGQKTFGHFRYGGALGLCLLDGLICVMPRIHSNAQVRTGRQYWGWEVNIGVDIFRAVARGLARGSVR